MFLVAQNRWYRIFVPRIFVAGMILAGMLANSDASFGQEFVYDFYDSCSDECGVFGFWRSRCFRKKMPPLQIPNGQEIIYDSCSGDFCSLAYWPFWHCKCMRFNGYARYGVGFTKGENAGADQCQIPVHPPADSPTFGYFQPGWKQLAGGPRMPAGDSRGIQTFRSPMSAALDVPPSPAPSRSEKEIETQPSDVQPLEDPGIVPIRFEATEPTKVLLPGQKGKKGIKIQSRPSN